MEAGNKNEQIFEKISDLVKSSEFNSQVLEFIQKFANKFNSEEEENSHEHYQLHKDYMYILENLIEV
jgi:di/tripeptidase